MSDRDKKDERVQRPYKEIDGVMTDCVTAWELYNATFQDGDEVLLIEDDGGAYYGTIINTNDYGVKLKLFTGEEYRFDFDVVRFMAHTGFPVRRLLGADGSSSVERHPGFGRKGTTLALRRALMAENRAEENFDKRREIKDVSEPVRIRRAYYGDPFEIENVSARLHNPGKTWVPKWWWRPELYDYEECVELIADDGARAMLWDLPSVFHFEIETRDSGLLVAGIGASA